MEGDIEDARKELRDLNIKRSSILFEKDIEATSEAYSVLRSSLYKNLLGEIEARDVANRLSLTKAQRDVTTPFPVSV